MSDGIYLSALECERTFRISRFAVQRAALRGEVGFRILPGGRTTYSATDVQGFAAARLLLRPRRPLITRRKRLPEDG